MFGLIKKVFTGLLTGIVSASNHTKCDLLSNQKCKIQPTLFNLHPNEYRKEFYCYPFAVKLDRCAGRCNIINDLSNKACLPNKTEDLNLSVLNMITEINESKHQPSIYHAHVNVNFLKQNVIKINGGITINVYLSVKKHHICEKEYVWKPATCNFENGKYLASIMNDSTIIGNYKRKRNIF